MGLSRFLSLGSRSLKEKMQVSFALMSIIPLLIMAYLVTGYIFPSESGEMNFVQISIIVVFSIWISVTGFLLAKEIILPVINLSFETKIIASGEQGEVLLRNEKELVDMASVANSMTSQIKGYVGELQQYHQRTYSLNAKIHQKVFTLTNLMRLGDLISSGARFREIADFATVRMAEEVDKGFCALFIKESSGKYALTSSFDKSGRFMRSSNIADELYSLEKNLLKKGFVLTDLDGKEMFRKDNGWQNRPDFNAVFVPMTVNAAVIGIIAVGNYEPRAKFGSEEVNVFKAYSKELVLAFESEQLGQRIKSIDVIDRVTGLYSMTYLEERLAEEINRSVYYQRPCSLIIVVLDGFTGFTERFGQGRAEYILKRVAEVLSRSIPPVGKTARFGYCEFGILLPERNKRESIEMAEQLVGKIAGLALTLEKEGELTISAGVGENPIDGASAGEIVEKARKYAAIASGKGRNKVIGWE